MLNHFASATTDLAGTLAALGGVLVGLWAILKLVITQAGSDREADRLERKALIDSINNMAKSNKLIADETAKGNREAKERNGHLGEQSIHLAEMLTANRKDILNAVSNIKTQHVEHQHVDNSEVKTEVVNKSKE